jgi:hypothetical protein
MTLRREDVAAVGHAEFHHLIEDANRSECAQRRPANRDARATRA